MPPPRAGVLGRRRNPFAAWIGLPIITLGIYCLVWVYKTNKELSEYDPRIKVNPTLSVLAFLIGWVVIVPPFVAAWRLGTRTQAAQRSAGVPETTPWVAFLLFVVGGGPLLSPVRDQSDLGPLPRCRRRPAGSAKPLSH